MSKEYLIHYLMGSKMNLYEFLYEYCIYKGKDPELTKTFLQICILNNMLPSLFSYAITIMCQEYNLTIIKDIKTNQILYAYEFKGYSNADSQEYVQNNLNAAEKNGSDESKETKDL